jgi:hypothetical protein
VSARRIAAVLAVGSCLVGLGCATVPVSVVKATPTQAFPQPWDQGPAAAAPAVDAAPAEVAGPAAATAPAAPPANTPGCARDMDCKGDRVCESGQCVSPSGN